MEQFLHDVQSQTIDLSVLDTMSSFANIPYYFYYENKTDTADFMTSDMLRNSFYVALLDFPILAGHLVMDGAGHATIVVDRDNLNLPEYRESQSRVHFSELVASKFSWHSLPDGVATAGPLTAAGPDGTIKLANIHVVRMLDNSGVIVFANIVHYVVDGAGYCQFINRWAEVGKWMHGGSATGELPAFAASFARNTILEHLPNDRKSLDRLTKELCTTSGPLSKWLAWISPELRGRVLNMVVSMTSTEGHVFYISPSAMASLRRLVQGNVHDGMRLSDNDILTALISMVVAQGDTGKASTAAGGGFLAALGAYLLPSMFAPAKEFVTEVLLDSRPRLQGMCSAGYTGNVIFVRCLASSMETLCGNIDGQSLALVARNLRNMVNDTDAPFIGQLIDTLSKDPSCFMCPKAHDITNAMVAVSNQSRFTLYDTDFGGGIPVWVSPIAASFANFVTVIPVHPAMGGYAVYMTTTKRAMENVLRNEFWMKSVELLY
ncbi:hypothetical protein H4R26_003856 [Coemansia thaxteri]|uniref:Uncharacterized protein n=1 Tax=Coemansia thaxteri TaxID=2663907 RepID=A0A9W8EH94_9FUNG|nr:hypothetical protein H4R26_003856 [Coemansia thaxteri]